MDQAQGSPTLPEASIAAAEHRGAARGGRVLIVDEEPELPAGLRSEFENEEIDVVFHPSPAALPPVVRSVDPDVILLDFATPDVFEGGRLETRAPLILFSSCSDRELARLSERVGAHGYLCKSDGVPAIVSRVKTWIAASRAVRGA